MNDYIQPTLKQKVIQQMRLVENGMPLSHAAAKINMMPHELNRIYKLITKDNQP